MKTQTAKRNQKPATIPAYKDAGLPSAKRVRDLMSRMTLEEKAAQMLCIWQQKAQTLVDAEGNFDEKKARAAFRNRRGLGQVGRPSDAGWLFSFYGFVSEAREQTAQAQSGILLTASVYAGLAFFATAVCLFFYPISREVNRKIADELAERRKTFAPQRVS
jgi:hypothetical protein